MVECVVVIIAYGLKLFFDFAQVFWAQAGQGAVGPLERALSVAHHQPMLIAR